MMAATATTYFGRVVLERLSLAQELLDEHLRVGPGGRCKACGEAEPCSSRLAAMATFARYHRLPRRTPGLASKGLH
jgi:hypothetical protein